MKDDLQVIDQSKIFSQYKGLWVVLDVSGQKVLSSGKTLKVALDNFYKKFKNQTAPSVFKVPAKDMAYIGAA